MHPCNRKKTVVVTALSFLVAASAQAFTTGEDTLYAIISTSGSTQDFGIIDPAVDSFTRINQIFPTGLGWPLGDIASQPDPINGYFFTRQMNPQTSLPDILAIQKSDGSTKWLNVDGSVVGYDTQTNKLILRDFIRTELGTEFNRILSYSIKDATSSIIVSDFAPDNKMWQAGGIGAVDSFNRTAFQLAFGSTSKLYSVNLDSGVETSISLAAPILNIAWDSKNTKLFGLYDSNQNGQLRVAEINTETGELTNIGGADSVQGLTNYVQFIAPNDQRYYVQQSPSEIVAVSLADGTVLGTFTSPLRLLPPGAVVIGSDLDDETVSFDIADPDSSIIKLGTNRVDYQGNSISSGDIFVAEGVLAINGKADSASAVVSKGATLGGSGTVGSIVNNGTISPGNSIGTLNVNGDVVMNPLSVTNIEIDPMGSSDKITASGIIQLDGLLTIIPFSGMYESGSEYLILEGDEILGAFSQETLDTSINSSFNLAYETFQQGNNFYVRLTESVTSISDSGSVTYSINLGTTAGVVTYSGAGVLTVTGQNTHTSGFRISNGVLAFGSVENLGTGSISLSNATIRPQSNLTISNPITIEATGGIFETTDVDVYSTGVMSGTGGLTKSGDGVLTLSGFNTYSGGTTVVVGTLSVAGSSATGTGNVFVGSGATLMGTGTITGSVDVSGILKPGNSPGYLSTTATVTMNTGSSYLQDIAGTVQASSTSPVGDSGYYSFLNVTSGQFVIKPGVILAPRLSNLFSVDQSGFGSATFVPGLGNRFRMVTAADGISGRFSSVTQPAELASGTQFLPVYNMAGGNSIDLAVIPTSYQATIAAGSGNANAQSVGDALTQIAQGSLAGTATAAQDQLLYAISSQTSAQGIASFAQSLSGEVYAANVVVTAQATQRMQQTVLNRLGGSGGLSTSGLRTTGPGTAGASTPSEQTTFSKGNVWGEVTYQRGDRSSDDRSGGWNSNLFQLTFGSDLYTAEDTTFGAGFSLSNTTMNPVYGSSTVQQGALFAYGKMPVGADFVLDAIASIGLSSSDISRNDITGLSSGFRNKSVSGNDALIGLGLSRAFETSNLSITPFARVTWQVVTQSGVNGGQAASALSVDRYTGNGVRGVLGLAAGSKVNDPMSAKYTYRGFVGVGVDSSALLNPTLNASIVGIGTNIATPNAGKVFVQAGLYGTAKMSNNTFAYAGISAEARSGQTLGTVNLGLKVQF